jgi:oligopeptide transport system permease protein
MAAYIVGRVLWTIPVLIFVSLITFVLMHSVEGGPWDREKKLPDAVVQNLNVKYGLDEPLYRQYGRFLLNALKGDIGISFQRQDKPVLDILAQGFKVTAVLGLLAVVCAVLAGVSLGVLAATHRNGIPDYASLLLASLGSAIPSFALGIFLIYLFAVKLQVLPVFGWGTPAQAILPLVTLAALPTAILARMTRASLLEVLRQDYIRTARAKGLRTSTVLYKHALRNALIPILTAVGPITAHLVTGSFIVEQIYAIPGTGRLVVQSINARDYGMIMGSTLFYASIICFANLVVDVTYAIVDPRIRFR